MSRPDVVVIGGGPAGSAAAIWLARSGARVTLVERKAAAHHKVCGEFVSADAARHLRALGFDAALLRAVPIETVRLLHGEQVAEAVLPFPACSLSRKQLDGHLLDIAAGHGVDIHRGVTARGARTASGVDVQLSDGSRLSASALFLATGKHDLRGWRRGAGIQNQLIGLKMHLALTPAASRRLSAAVELLFFDGGYAGLQLLDEHRANLCLLVAKRKYETLGRSWPALLDRLSSDSPPWRERLAGARLLWKQPLSIYGLPYVFVTEPEAGPLFRLGDQLAVVPSFAGDGIAMALSSARQAAKDFVIRGPDALAYHRRMAKNFGYRVRGSAWASRLLEQPVLQALAVEAAAQAPGLLRWAAAATRVGGRNQSAA